MIPTLSDSGIGHFLLLFASSWLALSTILLVALLSAARNRGALAYRATHPNRRRHQTDRIKASLLAD